jgi:Redoxin
MYPHERSLVQRYKDRPFVLLGVNADADAAALKEIQERRGLPWRSWADGPPKGPLCEEWKVKGFPTLYLIDANGVVRYESVGPPTAEQLDAEIEKLVKEVEK